jgi:hypothetical protein
MILVHIVDLARAIGVHRNTIRNWVKGGRLSCRPGPGKGLIFSPEGFACLCEEFHLDPQSLAPRELGGTAEASPRPAARVVRPVSPASKEESMKGSVVGSVMVVGGGIAGIQASLDLADSGYYVYLVEQSAGIGGKMSQLDKTYPTNDCAM